MAILDVQIPSGCTFETQTVIRVSWGAVEEGRLQIYIHINGAVKEIGRGRWYIHQAVIDTYKATMNLKQKQMYVYIML